MKEKIEKIIQEGLKTHLISLTHAGSATPEIQKTAQLITEEFINELEDLKREIFVIDVYSFEKVQSLIDKLNK